MTSFTWHPQRARWRYGFAAVSFALAAFVWLATRSEPEMGPRFLAAFFAFAALALLIEQDTRVDAASHSIVREGRLFGRLRVWLRRHSLSEFSGVATRRQIDTESEGRDTVFVGLRRCNGCFMAIRYFYAATNQRSREAEGLAQELAKVTGLKLHEDMD